MNLFGEESAPIKKVDEPLVKRKKLKLGDFLNDINMKNGNLLLKDPDAHKDLSPFLVLSALSKHKDCMYSCDELNKMNLPKDQFYHYLYTNIRKRKRFSKFHKGTIDDDIKMIMEFYKYSHERAEEAYEILSKKDGALDKIKYQMRKGGT